MVDAIKHSIRHRQCSIAGHLKAYSRVIWVFHQDHPEGEQLLQETMRYLTEQKQIIRIVDKW